MHSIASRIAVLGILAAAPVPALAFGEPPIRNAQDAACRDEARAQVFTAPDPEGRGLYATGKAIYERCMTRSVPRRSARAGA